MRLVLSTYPDRASAEKAARALVEARAVACATILPGARSIYRWKGAVEETDEVVVLFKTAAERIAAAMEAIRAGHPYEVPEIVALAPDAVFPPYLEWVRSETEA